MSEKDITERLRNPDWNGYVYDSDREDGAAEIERLRLALADVLEIMPMDRDELETGPLRIEETYKREMGKDPSENHDEFTEWCLSRINRARATLQGQDNGR